MNNVGSGNVARLGGCRTILSKGIIIIVLSPVENVIRTFFRRKFAPIPDHSLTKLAGIDDGSVRGAITILQRLSGFSKFLENGNEISRKKNLVKSLAGKG